MDTGILGIDGEAIGGDYRLLGSSSYSQLSLRGRLTSQQCFDFLIDCASRHKRLYGYGLGFDVCNWIKDLTNSQLNRLYGNGKCYTEQGLRFYRVIYIPNVMFKIDRLKGIPTNARGRETEVSATVIDLMRWHRSSFADVANAWGLGSIEDRTSLRIIKEDRPNFSDVSMAIVERYNRSECEMIAELGKEMEHGLRELGIPLSYPLTSGGVAGRLATKYRVQDYHQDPPEELVSPMQSAFYGGRMQTCRFGKFSNANHFDIRSAYAWAMSRLPDMLGKWKQIKYPNVFYSPYGIRKVQWNIDEGKYPVMPFPHRNKNGYISYPPNGTGWYWLPIVTSAVEMYGYGSIKCIDGWDYFPATNHNPFWYMLDLHSSRMAMKAVSSPLDGLLKLIMVSAWGRMCSDGTKHRYGHGYSRSKSPTRGLIDWAGMTTSMIQARLLSAILQNHESFISCCVDGYWSQANGPVTGDNLGDWSKTKSEELFLIRQSCYWDKQNGEWSAHTSGINNGLSILEKTLEEWQLFGWRGSVDFENRSCRGLRKCAVEGGVYDRLGEFENTTSDLKLNPGFGRYGHICPTIKSGSKDWERWLPYWPPISLPETESEPFTQKCDREMKEELLGDTQNEVIE